MLTGSLSAPVNRAVEQTLGVDLQITPSIGGSETDPLTPSARVILGKRLSNRAYVTFARPLGTTPSATQILVLEYDQNDRLGLGAHAERRPHLLHRFPRAASPVMRTWGSTLAAALAIVAAAAASVLAQAPAATFVGQPVVDVGIFVEGRALADPLIAGLVETHVGAPLSMAEVRQSITHIFGLGRFQDVQVDASSAPGGGVALRYNLVPLHNVQRVDLRGTPVARRAPRHAARCAVVNRFGTSPPLQDARRRSRRFLEQLYHDRGFLAATVVPLPQRNDTIPTARCWSSTSSPAAQR